MRSNTKITKCGNLTEKRITPTNAQKEKMEQNYQMRIKENTVEYIKPPKLEKQEMEMAQSELKAKADAGTATIKDITNFITNYL